MLKVEVAVLGSLPLISLIASVDVKQQLKKKTEKNAAKRKTVKQC